MLRMTPMSAAVRTRYDTSLADANAAIAADGPGDAWPHPETAHHLSDAGRIAILGRQLSEVRPAAPALAM